MKALVHEYREAHKRGDVKGMMELYYWQGVEDDYRKRIKEALQEEIRWPLGNLEYLPLEEGDLFAYESKGKMYVPNLEPVGKLHISFRNEEFFHYTQLVGKVGEQYFFVQPAAKETVSSP